MKTAYYLITVIMTKS